MLRVLPCVFNGNMLVIYTAILVSGFLGPSEQQPVSFDRQIRPLLASKCILCHGNAVESRHADLRLDTREAFAEKSLSTLSLRASRPHLFPIRPEGLPLLLLGWLFLG